MSETEGRGRRRGEAARYEERMRDEERERAGDKDRGREVKLRGGRVGAAIAGSCW